jgi:hypothetical protein
MSVTDSIGLSEAQPKPFCAAYQMDEDQRRTLAISALAGVQPIAHLAEEHGVSRKFIYAQTAKADAALDDCFRQPGTSEEVLCTLQVTPQWLRAFILELTLNGHSSTRGVLQIIDDLLPTHVSQGTIHNVVHAAAEKARTLNAAEDLSGIRVGAHDEIFQAGQPVLAGADAESTYCYLLAQEQGRGETEWAVHLWDLGAKGLQLAYTLADLGPGLRAGQAMAWPDTPCHGDVFHVEREVSQIAVYLENRAWGAMGAAEKLSAKMARAKRHQKGQRFAALLGKARQAEKVAVQLADDVACLARWLRQDILTLAGPDLETRRALFDWVVAELRSREALAPHRLGPLCGLLAHHREEILGFVSEVEKALAAVAREYQVAETTVQALCQLEGIPLENSRHEEHEADLYRQLGSRFHPLQQAVQHALAQVVRASSIIENLNSRLRCYFFLRRELGTEYLELLRFFLNHHRFPRSRRKERAGRSPIEILTGQTQPHWLDVLGFGPRASLAA